MFAVWEESASVTFEQIASDRTIKHTSPLGARYVSTGSATAQIFLSDLTFSTVLELIGRGIIRLQDGWNVDGLKKRLKSVRELGYATNLRETLDDEIGTAAPVYDRHSKVVAAVLLAAPAYRVDEQTTEALIEQCISAAAKISIRLDNSDSR